MGIDYHALLPEIILGATVLLVLAVDLIAKQKYYAAIVGLIGLFAAFVPLLTLGMCESLSFCDGSLPRVMFNGSYVVDNYAIVLKGLFLLTAFVALLLSVAYVEADVYYEGEFYFLLLSAALGAVLMSSSRDFITMIVALELVSGPGFLLAGWRKADEKSNEAALKFFIVGVAALSLLLFGVSLLYGLTGTQSFAGLREAAVDVSEVPLFTMGVIFVLLGFGFKVSAVPFHYWTPDTYEGAPTPVTAWLAVGSKTAGFVALLSVAYFAFPDQSEIWGPILWLVAVVTMTVGNFVAIKQTNIVRLLGYSSIAQAGFMLVPFGAAAAAGADLTAAFSATIIYLLIYAAMTLGAFGVIIAVSQRIGSVELKDWSGLSTYAPGLASLLAIFFLSLAGIPPLAGWFAKLAMFSAAIGVEDAWGYSIAVIAALNSVVAFVYYSKVIKVTFFEGVPETVDAGRRLVVAPTLKLALALAVVAVFVFGIFPGLITELVDLTTEVLATGF